MRKIQGIPLVQICLYCGPQHHLSRIRYQVLDDCAALRCLINGKKRFSWLPAILYGFIPMTLVLGRLSNDDVDAVIPHI